MRLLVLLAIAIAVVATAGAVDGARKHRHREVHHPKPPTVAAPLQAMQKHACGLHRGAAHSHEQMIAHHFCSKQPDGLMQCALFDTDKPDARLIGVEYIITAERFKALPESERRLWHSHVFEVESGQLTPMPLAGGRNADVPVAAQRAVLTELMGSFGKTVHTWNFPALNRDAKANAHAGVPIGPPQLMVSFTGPNQATKALLAELDRRAGNSHTERAAWRRAGPNALKVPAVMANGTRRPEFSGVDAWESGVTPVFAIAHVPTGTREIPGQRREVEVELKPAEALSGAASAAAPHTHTH